VREIGLRGLPASAAVGGQRRRAVRAARDAPGHRSGRGRSSGPI